MTEVVTAALSVLPSTDYDTVWLADLVKATKAVAASPERCDPAIVRAFSDRLQMRADVRSLFEGPQMGTGAH
jgi:hypothetical protein